MYNIYKVSTIAFRRFSRECFEKKLTKNCNVFTTNMRLYSNFFFYIYNVVQEIKVTFSFLNYYY